MGSVQRVGFYPINASFCLVVFCRLCFGGDIYSIICNCKKEQDQNNIKWIVSSKKLMSELNKRGA